MVSDPDPSPDLEPRPKSESGSDSGSESEPDITITLNLVKRAQDGDQRAGDRLFERYYERVRKVVRIRLGARLRSRVESGDILQETFIAALDSFDCFQMHNEASFINWLSRIAERKINDAADYHGAKRRNLDREVPLDSTNQDEDSRGLGQKLPDQGRAPWEELGEQEQEERMETCLASMSRQYRELILLRDYMGHSWEEVAEEAGRPSADAARDMHARARVVLTKCARGSLKSSPDQD